MLFFLLKLLSTAAEVLKFNVGELESFRLDLFGFQLLEESVFTSTFFRLVLVIVVTISLELS